MSSPDRQSLAKLPALVARLAAEYPAANLAVEPMGDDVAYVDAAECDAGHVAIAAVRSEALAAGFRAEYRSTRRATLTLRIEAAS